VLDLRFSRRQRRSFAYSSTLLMEAIFFSETFGSLRCVQRYNPEVCALHSEVLSDNSEVRRVCIMDIMHMLLLCNFCSGWRKVSVVCYFRNFMFVFLGFVLYLFSPAFPSLFFCIFVVFSLFIFLFTLFLPPFIFTLYSYRTPALSDLNESVCFSPTHLLEESAFSSSPCSPILVL
jgi:hypothetical protein